jgi:hypothetical protein
LWDRILPYFKFFGGEGWVFGGVECGFHFHLAAVVGVLGSDGSGCLGREGLVHDVQLFSSHKMSRIKEQFPFRRTAPANLRFGIDEGDQRADSGVAGAVLFEEEVEIEIGWGFGHDEAEEVALEVDLASEVVARDGFEVADLFLGEVGVVEAGGFRGHGNSFQEGNRTYILLYTVSKDCQASLTMYKNRW